MNKIIAFQVSFLIVFLLTYFFLSGSGSTIVFAQRVSSSKTPTPTPTIISTQTIAPTATATSKPTEAPTPKPTIKPTSTPTPTSTPVAVPKYTSQQINEFIERFAGQYALDPNIVRHIALCESGFNPEAVNGPYTGLFQFGATTWQGYRKKMGENPDPNLRVNAEEAVQTASYALSLGNGRIWPNCQP